tara:strand:- start:945 stop:1280 length:336 start_codon:yes stop_codon:yes gene_type:complete
METKHYKIKNFDSYDSSLRSESKPLYTHNSIILPTMKTAYADHRGRVTLGGGILTKYGKKFAIVETPKEIVLVPIAKDPLKALQKIGKGIDKFTIQELKAMARQQAQKEIL